MGFGKAFAGEDDASRTVGDLAAIEFAHAAFDGRVERWIVTKASFGKRPLPSLRTRIVTGIAKINFCDAG